MTNDSTTLEFGPSTRIVLGATLASAGIGLFLALFQVQGWVMPKPIALPMISVLVLIVAVGVSLIVVEAVRWVRRLLEHRATSASWVVSTEPGLLDYEADGIRAQNRFTRELNKLHRGTEALGMKLDRHAKRMTRLQGKGAKRRQRAANRSAKSINKSAAFIEKRLALLKALVRDIERNYRGFIGVAAIETELEYEAAMKLRESVASGRATTAGTLESMAGYRVAVEDVEGMNLSRTVRIASGRLAKALKGIEAVFKAHERATAGLVADLDTKLREWQRRPTSG